MFTLEEGQHRQGTKHWTAQCVRCDFQSWRSATSRFCCSRSLISYFRIASLIADSASGASTRPISAPGTSLTWKIHQLWRFFSIMPRLRMAESFKRVLMFTKLEAQLLHSVLNSFAEKTRHFSVHNEALCAIGPHRQHELVRQIA